MLTTIIVIGMHEIILFSK